MAQRSHSILEFLEIMKAFGKLNQNVTVKKKIKTTFKTIDAILIELLLPFSTSSLAE